MLRLSIVLLAACVLGLSGCPDKPSEVPGKRARYHTALAQLNDGACLPGQKYVQEELREPTKIGAHADNILETELVVRIRKRCVPVWVSPNWEMQTLNLRTYGFPREPGIKITDKDADDPSSPNIAWSAPGPTFVLSTATAPGAPDGSNFKMRLYNRMPHSPDPHACQTILKCNKGGPNAGVDPATGECKVPLDPKNQGAYLPMVPSQEVDGNVIEPPNCFHGPNSTNFHFHGFHVSPHLGQDFVGLELRPPKPFGVSDADMPTHGPHGESGVVRYGQFDFDVDRLRYTQPPGTHWYHAHKHGSTALQVLNGLVGTFEIRGRFDEQLENYFETKGGGKLTDRLMVVQQLQEKQPGLGGADQNNSVLINGQANPIVTMAKGEIQRWRFVGATMQASAALRVGFPDANKDSPEVRQIAMDGVQFSPQNYTCQPFLNNPDCSAEKDETPHDELTSFDLSPGNRIDLLVKAPSETGTHCMVFAITSGLDDTVHAKIISAQKERAAAVAGTCGMPKGAGLGPLFTLKVEDRDRPMTFPTETEFPPGALYLADIPLPPPVTKNPKLHKDIYYQMVNQLQLTDLPTGTGVQFWISQQKYNGDCANETLTLNVPEQWTLWNNSGGVAHPFHIHQNPFQLVSQSDRTPPDYKYPVWRDTMPIPKAAKTVAPNSNPSDNAWGHATIRYVAKEFTGSFVNHCHILGHEDRGMMHNTQASCADGKWATTGGVADPAKCDAQGFCPDDCETGKPIPAAVACEEPPDQGSDWPNAYGYKVAE